MNLAKGGKVMPESFVQVHADLRRRGCKWYNEAMVITTGSFPPRNNVPAQFKAGEQVLTAEQTRKLQEGIDELNQESDSGSDSEGQA